jgi:hypothetical protein
VRRDALDDRAVDATAHDIAALRQQWRATLEELRTSPLYRSCLIAYGAQDSAQLTVLVPQLFAECSRVAMPPPLYYPMTPASGRRRPGHSPFLTAEACASRIAQYRDDGIMAEASGTQWWETEIQPVTLGDDPGTFDTPLALRFDPTALSVPVFQVGDGERFRIYTSCLRATFTVVLQHEVDDEWWQAFAGSYASWRDDVAAHLRAQAIGVRVQDEGGEANE